MDAWLRTEAVSKGASFRFRVVHNPLPATPVTGSAARKQCTARSGNTLSMLGEWKWGLITGNSSGTDTNKNKPDSWLGRGGIDRS
jgi:hypothetical protein